MRNVVKHLVLAGFVAVLPASAWAQGAMLPGAGPINSAMGGAGTALPNESIGALMFNPALITSVQGNQISFTTEFIKDSIKVRTTVTKGGLSGDATSTGQVMIVPAFGWMLRDPSKKLALGFGLIGMAGFSTDYPQDNASLFFAQPPNGRGRNWSSLSVTKIPAAFAFQVTPKLSLGASFNTYVGLFSIAPLTSTDSDVSDSGRWYAEAGRPSQKFAFAGQVGFFYQATPTMSIGGSVTTPQNFAAYEWNSTNADPASRGFGQARTLTYDLDGPMVVSVGIGLKPGSKTQLAVDGMFTKYDGVAGFGSTGGVVNGVVTPFGWRNVWTMKAGVQHAASDKLTVRAGYHYSQMPLRSEVVVSTTSAPVTFQHHLSGGFGFKMFPFLEMNASVSYAPRQHVAGSLPDMGNVTIGTLDVSNAATKALIGLNFRF